MKIDERIKNVLNDIINSLDDEELKSIGEIKTNDFNEINERSVRFCMWMAKKDIERGDKRDLHDLMVIHSIGMFLTGQRGMIERVLTKISSDDFVLGEPEDHGTLERTIITHVMEKMIPVMTKIIEGDEEEENAEAG